LVVGAAWALVAAFPGLLVVLLFSVRSCVLVVGFGLCVLCRDWLFVLSVFLFRLCFCWRLVACGCGFLPFRRGELVGLVFLVLLFAGLFCDRPVLGVFLVSPWAWGLGMGAFLWPLGPLYFLCCAFFTSVVFVLLSVSYVSLVPLGSAACCMHRSVMCGLGVSV